MDELLEKIFANVNSWLVFAEAKHAANIALIVACMAAMISLDHMNELLWSVCILLTSSGICSLVAFYPKLGKWVFFRQEQRNISDNLLYFRTIKKYSGGTEEYLQRVAELYVQIKAQSFTRYQLDLADEIIFNSRIVSNKYILFQGVVYLDILAFILLIIGFIAA